MSDQPLAGPGAPAAFGSAQELPVRSATHHPRAATLRNLLRYIVTRLLLLGLTVVSAVYLTIVIANFGGYVDTIIASRIEEQVGFMMLGGWMADQPPDVRTAAAVELIATLQDQAGLNDPFFLRTLRWLDDGLTLNWGEPGRARAYGLGAAGKSVGEIIADNLSRSLLVFGLANVLLFFAAIGLALLLNRRQSRLLDRLFTLLAPISSAPAWVFGVLLTTFFLRVFGFSSGGSFDSWPSGDLRLVHLLVAARHLALPFLAVFLAGLFQSVYIWRSYFQVFSHEDYVDMAMAKGLPARQVDRNYILRPALPALLTSFALLLAALWQEIIALEYFFNVEGLGKLFVQALNAYDTPMIVAIVTTFAYLLAITVFIVDVLYVFVDPRVRLGNETRAGRVAGRRRGRVRAAAAGLVLGARGTIRGLRAALQVDPRAVAGALRRGWASAGQTLRALWAYPSAVFGLVVILFLLGVSVYTVIAIPYNEAIILWRGDGNIWSRSPRSALPAWVNLWRRDDLPPTMVFSSLDGELAKTRAVLESGTVDVTMLVPFTFDYADFPQEIIVDLTAAFVERGPHVTYTWVWPDGRERELTGFQPRQTDAYFLSRDERLQRRMRVDYPLEALFLGPDGVGDRPVGGDYLLRINALLFEPDSNIEATVTILGQVYGLAGTDNQRRDLLIPLLWGTPIALAFGLVAAFATSVGGMLLAAFGAWYGGVVDRVVQFLTEVNLILPFFPVSLMVFVMYSRSIVVILAVTVALTLFGSALKTYRATFLQVRSEPYIEAARAYGASDRRIVFRYLVPRIVTLLLPRIIILVPGYVFLEATLSFLGVTEPHLPTWGKLVVSALSYGVQVGSLHLVLFPLGVLFLTGFSFAMLGLALEQILDPKLRWT